MIEADLVQYVHEQKFGHTGKRTPDQSYNLMERRRSRRAMEKIKAGEVTVAPAQDGLYYANVSGYMLRSSDGMTWVRVR